MLLEARAANCCSSKYVLKLDGRAIGKFEGRWFSESLDVNLTERRQLQLQKVTWMGSQFVLRAEGEEQPLGTAQRSGFFSSSWDLYLGSGEGRLERAGWFDSSYVVRQGDGVVARVDRLGLCERGWRVDALDALVEGDLLLIGLVYHTIRQRQERQSHAGGHAGS
jgi:hypothetical protein